MRALLLAAGLGTRLRPLTDSIPKCMVSIQGKPLLEYWFELLFQNGIERVVVNTHYLPDVVLAFIRQSKWSEQIEIFHEEELLGTAGTIRATASYFGGQDFFVAHADNFVKCDLARFLGMHATRPTQCAMSLLSFRTDNARSCGILELDEENVVLKFHEKVANPPGNLANGAVYVLTKEILDFIQSKHEQKLDFSNEVIPSFLSKIYCIETDGYHRDIGTIESLKQAQEDALHLFSDS
jgi:mannose-1-phosphate guanylyltransferase